VVATPAASASPSPTVIAPIAGVGGTGKGGSDGTGSSVFGPLLLAPLLALAGLILLAARRRRRRPEEAATGAGGAAVPPGVLAPSAVFAAATPPPSRDPAIEEDLEPIDEDAPLKKTRRTSRKAAEAVMAAAAGPVRTFTGPAPKGVSRAKVGYRQVRISSEPDAVRSTELGRLDRGDEIEILESHEGFLRVRTPDEITGWILRHTIVGGSAA
jgi:hypothetical protein